MDKGGPVPNMTVYSPTGHPTLISIDSITELVVFSLIVTVSTKPYEMLVINSENEFNLGTTSWEHLDSLCPERMTLSRNQMDFYCYNSKPQRHQIVTVLELKQEDIQNVSIIQRYLATMSFSLERIHD